MDIQPPSPRGVERHPDNVTSLEPRLAQLAFKHVLNERRGEEQVHDDIIFARSYFGRLRHPHYKGDPTRGILADLDTSRAVTPFRRHLIEISLAPEYEYITLAREPHAKDFQEAIELVPSDEKRAALEILQRLYRITLLDTSAPAGYNNDIFFLIMRISLPPSGVRHLRPVL